MKAERGQYAARFRAEGRREAEEMRSKTDAERTVLLAEAQKFAEETRGKAEAEAARILRRGACAGSSLLHFPARAGNAPQSHAREHHVDPGYGHCSVQPS